MEFTGRLLVRTTTLNKLVTRNAFTASKPDPSRPNMFRVGLTFASTALLWGLLFNQHRNDVQDYKSRNGLQ